MNYKYITMSNLFNPLTSLTSVKTLYEFTQAVCLRYNLKPSSKKQFINKIEQDHYSTWVKAGLNYDYNADFEYEYNAAGFRDTEVRPDVDCCYYGCSATFGQGVPVETRWTNLIDQELGWMSNNFGLVGKSVEEILNIFVASLQVINMRYAIFYLPTLFRFTVPVCQESGLGYRDLSPTAVLQNYRVEDSKLLKDYNSLFLLPDEYMYDRYLNYIGIILALAKARGITVLMASWAREVDKLMQPAPYYNPYQTQ